MLIQAKKNLYIGPHVRIIPLSYFNVGSNVTIAQGSILDCGGQIWCDFKGRIEIGTGTYIGYNCVLLGGGEILIGQKVLIGPNTVITSQGHYFNDSNKFIRDQKTLLKKVIIEDDVWIGANCSILPGVTIGKGSIVGAGAVVTKDIPPYCIAVGVPAKVIASRL